MPHEIHRVLRAFAAQPWFMDARKAVQIVSALEFRAANGVRAQPYRDQAATPAPAAASQGKIAIVRLYGPILPRAEAMTDISQPAALLTKFQDAFRVAAADSSVTAIILDIDSPGGRGDLVPETCAMIRAARKPDRPIVAIANTMMCSAAYWIGCGADEISVTPSGEVGSIGAYVLHEDDSELLDELGVRMTFIREGPRKVEANPFEPLDDTARAALQKTVRSLYDMFVADVARGRHVAETVVRADPEKTDRHFGGGRAYGAKRAVALGMADRVETFDQLIARLQRQRGRSTASARRALAML